MREESKNRKINLILHYFPYLARHRWLLYPIPYMALSLFAYLKYGMVSQFSLAIAVLGLLPALTWFGKSREFLRDVTPFLTALLCYESLQGITGIVTNSKSVVYLSTIDQVLFGGNVVGTVQKLFMSESLTLVSSILYGLHFVIIAIASVSLWFLNRRLFKGYTLSMGIVSYMALFTFIVIPTAPPWLAGDGINLVSQGTVNSALLPIENFFMLFESDKFAAFPSLHVAYIILFVFYFIRLGKYFSYVACPIAAGVIFSVIYLGQHYVTDVLGGVAYCAASYLITEKIVLKK